MSKDCSVNRKCFHCNCTQNSALCNRDEQASKQAPRQEPKHETNEDQSVAMSNVKKKTNVLLQTSTTYAYEEDKSKKVTVTILLDDGSQKSFVSKNSNVN